MRGSRLFFNFAGAAFAHALPSSMDSVGSTDTPFFLASAPISSLERAKQLVVAAGGMHAAGEKGDAFNSLNLEDEESWRAGWKGKVEATINNLTQLNPGKEIIALAIAGGPACDWERGELLSLIHI